MRFLHILHSNNTLWSVCLFCWARGTLTWHDMFNLFRWCFMATPEEFSLQILAHLWRFTGPKTIDDFQYMMQDLPRLNFFWSLAQFMPGMWCWIPNDFMIFVILAFRSLTLCLMSSGGCLPEANESGWQLVVFTHVPAVYWPLAVLSPQMA